MEYHTVKEKALEWGISARAVLNLCQQQRIVGAVKFGSVWAIPKQADKPCDLRIKSGKYVKQVVGNDYVLKHFDTALLYFSLVYEFDGITCRITQRVEGVEHLLPLNLTCTDEGLLLWLKRRIIPKNRAYVENFLSKLGLNEKNTKGVLDVSMGLSLTDTYWTPAAAFQGSFDAYNLYDHNFSNTLALIAFTGYGTAQKSGFTSSPEFTTNGMLAKCWRRVKGKTLLYKSGTTGARNAGKEPYSEYLAYQVAQSMGIEAIPYSLSMWKSNLCSTCECFTSKETSFIPIGDLVQSGGLRAVMQYVEQLGEQEYQKLVDMLIFDSVICNTDRHFGNFGVLVSTKTNTIKGFAPLFDHGLSLFCYALEDSMEDLNSYAKTRQPATYRDFMELSQTIITKRQKEQLRHLLNFRFKKHSRYNMDAKRMKQIERFIQQRARDLLTQKN